MFVQFAGLEKQTFAGRTLGNGRTWQPSDVNTGYNNSKSSTELCFNIFSQTHECHVAHDGRFDDGFVSKAADKVNTCELFHVRSPYSQLGALELTSLLLFVGLQQYLQLDP